MANSSVSLCSREAAGHCQLSSNIHDYYHYMWLWSVHVQAGECEHMPVSTGVNSPALRLQPELAQESSAQMATPSLLLIASRSLRASELVSTSQ